MVLAAVGGGGDVDALSASPGAVVVAVVVAFAVAVVAAVAGFGGAVAALPVFTALFGVEVAVPLLTLTQLVSNASRVGLNAGAVRWRVVGAFALGAAPLAVAGALVFTAAPAAVLQPALGAGVLVMVAWRRLRPSPRRPTPRTFVAVGAASGFASALVGSVGPMTAPFFLALGLTRGAYIGTEAASAMVMHLTKTAVYGAGALLPTRVLLLGLALTPATIAGTWVGKKIADRIDQRWFVIIVEVTLVIAAVLLLAGV